MNNVNGAIDLKLSSKALEDITRLRDKECSMYVLNDLNEAIFFIIRQSCELKLSQTKEYVEIMNHACFLLSVRDMIKGLSEVD